MENAPCWDSYGNSVFPVLKEMPIYFFQIKIWMFFEVYKINKNSRGIPGGSKFIFFSSIYFEIKHVNSNLHVLRFYGHNIMSVSYKKSFKHLKKSFISISVTAGSAFGTKVLLCCSIQIKAHSCTCCLWLQYPKSYYSCLPSCWYKCLSLRKGTEGSPHI